MNRQIVWVAFACLAVCGVSGCETATPVKETAGAQPPSAPALATRPANVTEPGPEDADADTEFTTTDSGLKYRVLRKSSGTKPTQSNHVTVNYKGWLDDGTEFDKSYGRGPFSFTLVGEGQTPEVIAGWNEGVTYVGEGGMIELEIPGDLGYGARGFPPVIPANATLHFIVEVNKVQ